MSILDLPNRTIKKILTRLKAECSACGYNTVMGDLHHIIPRAKGGSDEHSNLTLICPNCHRECHNNLKVKFKTLQEHFGDTWKDMYFPELSRAKSKTLRAEKVFQIEDKRNIKAEKLIRRKDLVLNSNIDFTKYGWVRKVGELIEIPPQKVNLWMKQHLPDLYASCFIRKQLGN